MKALIDVNVVLDVLLDREPHAAASAAVWAAIEVGVAKGVLAAHAITTIHYLVRKERGNAKAKDTIAAILRVFGVAAVDETAIRNALALPFGDFEDAVTAATAQTVGCDLIVSRNPRDFRGSPVRVLAPEAAAHIFAQRQ